MNEYNIDFDKAFDAMNNIISICKGFTAETALSILCCTLENVCAANNIDVCDVANTILDVNNICGRVGEEA